ncbi:MAG: hypothetical protein JWR69_1181 [Pedosphaera sp.]|nr:hypothetical protein [Pedosphaera sp.]
MSLDESPVKHALPAGTSEAKIKANLFKHPIFLIMSLSTRPTVSKHAADSQRNLH